MAKLYKKREKLVYGVGVNDLNERVKVDGKDLKFYDCWRDMLKRCYDQKYQENHPTYKGCLVCDKWKSLTNFKKFFDTNYKEGFQLDKDILIPKNKIYGPDYCVFVPPYLNSLLIDSGKARGSLPLGVSEHSSGNGYQAQCNNGSGKKISKYFQTIPEAINWYRVEKTKVVREQVCRALSEQAIDQIVADALLARKF